MAHGYLSQVTADRPSFWIKSARRKIMPAEIEETMRRWRCRNDSTDDLGGIDETPLHADSAARDRDNSPVR